MMLRFSAQLYNEVGEKRSFARNLAALIGLPDNATCAALMTGVRALLPRWSRHAGCAHNLTDDAINRADRLHADHCTLLPCRGEARCLAAVELGLDAVLV